METTSCKGLLWLSRTHKSDLLVQMLYLFSHAVRNVPCVAQRFQRRDSRKEYSLETAYFVEQVVARNQGNKISCSKRLVHPSVHADFGNPTSVQTSVLTIDSNV